MTTNTTAMTIATSLLTCPHCGFQSRELMPTEACTWFHTCASCARMLSPKAGDCCVFCSYGDTPCPPVQASRGDASGGNPPSCCP